MFNLIKIKFKKKEAKIVLQHGFYCTYIYIFIYRDAKLQFFTFIRILF